MAALRCLSLLKLKKGKKRPEPEPEKHNNVSDITMKAPNPKRAKLEKDKDDISGLLDGIFPGLNTAPPASSKPAQKQQPLTQSQQIGVTLIDQLREGILAWIRMIIVDDTDDEISSIGYHGSWVPWLEISRRRGVIWKGPSLIPADLLDPGVDTKSESIYAQYVDYLLYHMTYQIPKMLPDCSDCHECSERNRTSTTEYGYLFIESNKHARRLSFPHELRSKIRTQQMSVYVPADTTLYISTYDLASVLGASSSLASSSMSL
jgi:hypothetical protein